MGALFSSPQPEKQQTHTSSTQSTSNRQSSYVRPWYEDPTSAQYQQREALWKERLLEEERKIQERKRVEQQCLIRISSRPLHRAVLQHPLAANWDPMPSNSAFIKTNVKQYTQEYNTVFHLFKTTTQKQFNIVQIERVQNPYLLGCYLLKKNEMECLPGNYVEERRVFHGTKQSNVQSICQNNFDWRLHGDSTGNSRENDSNVFCVHEMWLSSCNDTWKVRDSRHLHKTAFKPHRLAITIRVLLISHYTSAAQLIRRVFRLDISSAASSGTSGPPSLFSGVSSSSARDAEGQGDLIMSL